MIGQNISEATKRKLIGFKGKNKDAAAACGVSTSCAQRVRAKAGVTEPRPYKQFSDDELATLTAMQKAGRSYMQIAVKLGRTERSIISKVHQHRIAELTNTPAKVAPWVAKALAAYEKTGVK